MDTNFLAKAFGVWSGWAYKYIGDIPDGADPSAWITVKASELIGGGNFVSTVAAIKGSHYFYTADRLPESDDFYEIGDLVPTYEPPAEEASEEASEDPAPEQSQPSGQGENDAG